MPTPPDFQDTETPKRVGRVIDTKLPLTWLVGTAAAIIASYVVLYSNVDRLVRDMADLQITVRAGNSQSATLQGQIAILQFRVESLERSRQSGAEK
jgi:hypothetical protein